MFRIANGYLFRRDVKEFRYKVRAPVFFNNKNHYHTNGESQFRFVSFRPVSLRPISLRPVSLHLLFDWILSVVHSPHMFIVALHSRPEEDDFYRLISVTPQIVLE